MKLTRRELAAALVSTSALAQTPQPPAATTDELQAARDRLKTATDAVAHIDIPPATEPAFHFKA